MFPDYREKKSKRRQIPAIIRSRKKVQIKRSAHQQTDMQTYSPPPYRKPPLFSTTHKNRIFFPSQQITGHPDYTQSIMPSHALQLCTFSLLQTLRLAQRTRYGIKCNLKNLAFVFCEKQFWVRLATLLLKGSVKF